MKNNDWTFQASPDPLCKFATLNRKCAIVRQNSSSDRLDPRFNLPLELRIQVAQEPLHYTQIQNLAIVSRETAISQGDCSHIAIDMMPNDPWSEFDVESSYEGSVVFLKKMDIAFSRLMPTIKNRKSFISWGDISGSPEFVKISEKNSEPEWLLSWLKSSVVTDYFLGCVRGSSASQKRVSEDDIKECPAPILSDSNRKLYAKRSLEIRKICKDAEGKSKAAISTSERRLIESINKCFRIAFDLPDTHSIQTPKVFKSLGSQSHDRLDVLYNTPGHVRFVNLLKGKSSLVPLGDIVMVAKEKISSEVLNSYIGLEHILSNTGEYSVADCEPGDYGGGNFVPKESLLYGRLRPYLNKVIYYDLDYSNIGCSTEIYVCRLKYTDDARILCALSAYLRSDYGFNQLRFLPAGGNLPRVPEDYFLEILVPPLHSYDDIELLNKKLHECYELFKKENSENQTIIEKSQQVLGDVLSNPWLLIDNKKYKTLRNEIQEALQ